GDCSTSFSLEGLKHDSSRRLDRVCGRTIWSSTQACTSVRAETVRESDRYHAFKRYDYIGNFCRGRGVQAPCRPRATSAHRPSACVLPRGRHCETDRRL